MTKGHVESEKVFKSFASKVNKKSKPLKKLRRSLEKKSKNIPNYDLRSLLYKSTGVDLTRVDGFDVLVLQRIIAEVGLDMSRWPTIKNFTSWLGLSPNNKITGGKIISSSTRKTNNRASRAFRMAALAVSRSNSPIGAFYRKMKSKDGPQSAITATAHKLARIFYVMVSKQVEYSVELLKGKEEENRKRRIKYLKQGAAKLGYKLVEIKA